MTISEKVAYVRGLYDGLGLDSEKSGEARILSEVLDVLRDVGLQLDSMDGSMGKFYDDLSDLRDSVDDLEDAVFDNEDEENDGDLFVLTCPTCGEDLTVDDEALDAGVVDCPVCGGKFALSFEDEEDDGQDE